MLSIFMYVQTSSNLHHGFLDILESWEEEENWTPHGN